MAFTQNSEQIKLTLSTLVTKQRYEHSIRVADMAFSLAKAHDVNVQSAYYCGLIHDCAKDIKVDNQRYCFSVDQRRFMNCIQLYGMLML